VATAVAQPYGIIFQADSARIPNAPPEDWEAYACTLAYHTYRVSLDPQTHAQVRTCLQQAVQRFPDYATAWALLAIIYIDELRFRRAVDGSHGEVLDKASAAARKALELDPANVRSLQAQMMVFFFRKDVAAALEIGERAIAINPNDIELIGEYGVRLAVSGDWKRGGDLVARALDRRPAPPGYYETVLALASYMQDDYVSARTWIERGDVQANPLFHFIAAAIHGQIGDAAAAARERAWIRENAPDLVRNLRQEFEMRNMRPEDQVRFVEGLKKAGFSLPAL
jgi:tetratricopeptide (TPR) repeat protein